MLEPCKYFHPSLTFVGKARTSTLKCLSGAPLKSRLLVLPTNIRLGSEGTPRANIGADYENLQITVVKGFIKLAEGAITASLSYNMLTLKIIIFILDMQIGLF